MMSGGVCRSPGTYSVDVMRLLAFDLSAINGGIGSGIDNHVRLNVLNQLFDDTRRGEVRPLPARANDLVTVMAQAAVQRHRQLTGFT